MEELFIIWSGQKRKACYVNCAECNKEYLTRASKPNKFCSKDCKQKHIKIRVNVTCAWCKQVVVKKPKQLLNSKSGLYFCNRKCKDEAQRIGGIKAIQPSHFGTGKHRYRYKFLRQELVCTRCKYNEFRCSVEIHHIDHNRNNDSDDNLMPLCANCHAGLHNKLWSLDELL